MMLVQVDISYHGELFVVRSDNPWNAAVVHGNCDDMVYTFRLGRNCDLEVMRLHGTCQDEVGICFRRRMVHVSVDDGKMVPNDQLHDIDHVVASLELHRDGMVVVRAKMTHACGRLAHGTSMEMYLHGKNLLQCEEGNY